MDNSPSALQGVQLTDEEIRGLIGKAQEWALLHGNNLRFHVPDVDESYKKFSNAYTSY